MLRCVLIFIYRLRLSLQAQVKRENGRMTAFMQEFNVPALFRGLSGAASSRKIAGRSGVTDLVAQLERLNQGLEGVVAGIPDAAKLIEPLRSSLPTSSSRCPTARIISSGAPATPSSSTSLRASKGASPPQRGAILLSYDDLMGDKTTASFGPSRHQLTAEAGAEPTPTTTTTTPTPTPTMNTPRISPLYARGPSPLKPTPPSQDHQGQGDNGGEEAGATVMGRALHLPNIQKPIGGAGTMCMDPGPRALRQLEEIGFVTAYIDDYQTDLRQSLASTLNQKTTPPLLRPPPGAEPSPRARTHRRLVLGADGPSRGPADYHVHASEHPPPNLLEQAAVMDFFETIPEV
jgi:hypothetical protein